MYKQASIGWLWHQLWLLAFVGPAWTFVMPIDWPLWASDHARWLLMIGRVVGDFPITSPDLTSTLIWSLGLLNDTGGKIQIDRSYMGNIVVSGAGGIGPQKHAFGLRSRASEYHSTQPIYSGRKVCMYLLRLWGDLIKEAESFTD